MAGRASRAAVGHRLFDIDGALTATLVLPAGFGSRVMLANHAFGFYTLSTGEIVIESLSLFSAG